MPGSIHGGASPPEADAGLGDGRRPAGRRATRAGARRLALLVACGLGSLTSAGAAGQSTSPPQSPLVGRRVVQRHNDFTLRIERRVVQLRRVINFYRAEQAEGPWLWLRAEGSGLSGWAMADQVIPVDEAVEFFTEEIRREPSNVFAYVMRAMLWQDRKLIGRALRDYDEVIRLDPTRGWVYNNRGILHFERKDYEQAVADFDEAIRLEPANPSVYNNRGTLRRARKLYELAEADFSEAIRLSPGYTAAYFNRGLARADMKNLDRAIADFNEVIRLDPTDAMAYYHRGLAWSAKEQYDSALRDYDRAIELDGKQATFYRDRGTAWAALKQYDRAIADYDQAIRLAPGGSRAYYRRALARVEIKDFEEALADFDEAIRLNPRFDDAYLGRAWLLASCPNARLRDPRKAVESATRACELTDWHRPHDLGGLAAVYAETGNVAEALKWHSKALELLTAEGRGGLVDLPPLPRH